MKTILLAMTALSAVAAAAPAAAQYAKPYPDTYRDPYRDSYRDSYYGQVQTGASFQARIDELQARLDAGGRQGTISGRESWPLRRELRDLRPLASQYGMDGLS